MNKFKRSVVTLSSATALILGCAVGPASAETAWPGDVTFTPAAPNFTKQPLVSETCSSKLELAVAAAFLGGQPNATVSDCTVSITTYMEKSVPLTGPISQASTGQAGTASMACEGETKIDISLTNLVISNFTSPSGMTMGAHLKSATGTGTQNCDWSMDMAAAGSYAPWTMSGNAVGNINVSATEGDINPSTGISFDSSYRVDGHVQSATGIYSGLVGDFTYTQNQTTQMNPPDNSDYRPFRAFIGSGGGVHFATPSMGSAKFGVTSLKSAPAKVTSKFKSPKKTLKGKAKLKVTTTKGASCSATFKPNGSATTTTIQAAKVATTKNWTSTVTGKAALALVSTAKSSKGTLTISCFDDYSTAKAITYRNYTLKK